MSEVLDDIGIATIILGNLTTFGLGAALSSRDKCGSALGDRPEEEFPCFIDALGMFKGPEGSVASNGFFEPQGAWAYVDTR
ncbi:hypothetical protein L218DRAFT_1007921 [Marasmius fiardii PR-910]|nr:hypothetical protein L218DRAFT_1007921 [Marasmius fiardii PR-910]